MRKHVQYNEGNWTADLVIRSATQVDENRHSMWIANAKVTGDEALDYTRFVQHPDLCAALTPESTLTVNGENIPIPITFEAFSNLPAMPPALFNAWFDAAYECNEHWRLKVDPEKKESNPIEST